MRPEISNIDRLESKIEHLERWNMIHLVLHHNFTWCVCGESVFDPLTKPENRHCDECGRTNGQEVEQS